MSISNKDISDETESVLKKSDITTTTPPKKSSPSPEKTSVSSPSIKNIQLSASDIALFGFIIFLVVVAGINLYMYVSNNSKEDNLQKREKILQDKSLDLSKRDKHVDERRPDADADIERRTRNIYNKEKFAYKDRKQALQLCDEYGLTKVKENYLPKGTNKEIHLAYKISKKYSVSNVIQTIVSITSACENMKFDSTYLIHILHYGKLEDQIIKDIKTVEKRYPNQCSIEFIDVQRKFLKYSTNFTDEINNDRAYYSFALPTTLREVDKIIFLDVDTYVLDDLQELYDISFNGKNVIAGHWIRNTKGKEFKNYYKKDSPETFINTGVSLWNLRGMRDQNIESSFFDMLYKYQNNDFIFLKDIGIINIICEKKTQILPPKFGMVAYKDYEDALEKNAGYNDTEYLEAFAGPAVIHHSEIQFEPWRNLEIRPYGIFFYHYLKKTEFFDEYVKRFLKEYEVRNKETSENNEI